MKLVEIGSCNHGSVGNIMLGIAEVARENGFEAYTFSAPGRTQIKGVKGCYFIGSILERRLSDFINDYTGYQGALNYFGTMKLIHQLNKIKPDIIQLHNLHSNYINLNMLFEYLRQFDGKIFWTLHDCWAFTGNCPHFTYVECEKWKTACSVCSYVGYPKPKRDIGHILFQNKKNTFTSLKKMTIITPSKWLADLTRESFLNIYPVSVINNGIDLSLFKPRKSNFREKHNIEHKFVILAVAFNWNERKGRDRIQKIAHRLDRDKFQFVIVGGTKADIKVENSIYIPKTFNQIELAEIYTAADVLLNPTREDTFPTVNIEALACGTPVLSYGACGSAEAFDESCGAVVDDNNVIQKLEVLFANNYSSEACVRRAKIFDKRKCFAKYLDLYREDEAVEDK